MATVEGPFVFAAAYFCSVGSLARVNPLVFRGLQLRVMFWVDDYNPPEERYGTLPPNQSPKEFLVTGVHY